MKQLNKNQYYINGWIFDFRRMMALRGTYVLDIKIHNEQIYRCGMFPTARPNWMLGFFDEPEDKYNKVIIDAYNTYLVETILLEEA